MTQRAFVAYVGAYVLCVVLGLCVAVVLVPLWFGRP